MDGVHLTQGHRASARKQVTFNSYTRPQIDERLGRPWSHLVVLKLKSVY